MARSRKLCRTASGKLGAAIPHDGVGSLRLCRLDPILTRKSSIQDAIRERAVRATVVEDKLMRLKSPWRCRTWK